MSSYGLAVMPFCGYLQLSFSSDRRDSVDSGDNNDITDGTDSGYKPSTNVRQTRDFMK